MRVKRKQVIAAILGSIVVQGGAYGATATTTASSDYELNPVVVTATRSEKQDLNVPASTTVLSTKDLQNTGAQNLQVALGRVPGLDYETFGEHQWADTGIFDFFEQFVELAVTEHALNVGQAQGLWRLEAVGTRHQFGRTFRPGVAGVRLGNGLEKADFQPGALKGANQAQAN